jgi:hypothetical protein
VTFHLSKENIFTAEAVDLNSGRHHLWQVGILGSLWYPGNLEDLPCKRLECIPGISLHFIKKVYTCGPLSQVSQQVND